MGRICENRLSQNRRTCCGTSRSSATSLMVRNASGALSTTASLVCCGLRAAALGRVIVDTLLEDRRRLEHHHPPRRNRHFRASLRVASDALPLLAHHERAEGRQLHRLPPLETIGDLLEHKLNQRGRLSTRQSDLLVHRLTEIRPCDCLSAHCPCPNHGRVLFLFFNDMKIGRASCRERV